MGGYMMKKGILSVLIGLLALNASASPVNFQSVFRDVERKFNALDDKQQIGAAVVAALFGDMLWRRNNSLVVGLASRVKGFFKWVFAPSAAGRASELKAYLRTRWREWVPVVIAAIVAYKYRHSIPGLKMISRQRTGREGYYSSGTVTRSLREELARVPSGNASLYQINTYLDMLAGDPQIEVLREAANSALQARRAAVENFLDTVVSSESLPVDGEQFSLSPDELRAWVESNGGALKPLVERLPVDWPAFVTLKNYLTYPVTNTAVRIVLDPSLPEEKRNAIVEPDFITSTLSFFETSDAGRVIIAPFLTRVAASNNASHLPEWVVSAFCSRSAPQLIEELQEWLKTCDPIVVQPIADGLCTRFESTDLQSSQAPLFLYDGLCAIMAREQLDAAVVQRIGRALVTAYQNRYSIHHTVQISRDAQSTVKTVFRQLMRVAPRHMSALRAVAGVSEIEAAVERDRQTASSCSGIEYGPNAWND